MNCKQIEDLLPLYAGRDLDDQLAHSVSEHLQSCGNCARVADEYRTTLGLAQQYAPPVFSDHAYSSVRRQVLRQIENEKKVPLLPQLFAGWFRPRVAWAAATGLIVVLGIFALYLVVNRGADVRPVADNNPALNRTETPPESLATPQRTEATPVPLKPAGEKRRRIPSIMNRKVLIAAGTPNSSRAANNSGKLRDPDSNSSPAVDAAAEVPPLRVEMQTKNPNIRIIWFSQPVAKPAPSNSKGI